MGLIKLNNIRVYAYHGCLSEEAKIGSAYRVDLWVKTNLKAPAGSDNLRDTVDYVGLNKIVKTEMAKRSNLLENAAQRILNEVMKNDAKITASGVVVAKINPPLGGDVESVSVELTQTRKS